MFKVTWNSLIPVGLPVRCACSSWYIGSCGSDGWWVEMALSGVWVFRAERVVFGALESVVVAAGCLGSRPVGPLSS